MKEGGRKIEGGREREKEEEGEQRRESKQAGKRLCWLIILGNSRSKLASSPAESQVPSRHQTRASCAFS